LARPHPIFIGLVAMAGLVIGLEVHLLHRSRRRAAPVVSDEAPFAEAPPPAPAAAVAPAPVAPPVPAALPPPSPPVQPSSSAAAASGAIPAGADGGTDQGPAQTKRPLFVRPEPERVLRDADEQAFETLQLPEATRAAIRKINETYADTQRQLRAGLITTTEGLPTRREAIQQLLGAEAGHQFETAEHVATKQLRSQYRRQSLHGVPPGDVAPQSLP
jgi:hypothetical protein